MKSSMVDWSSLPSDLIRRVGDCLLATNDIEYYIYMDMRAACCSWRTAMADPCRRGTDADLLLFRPRQWIMLDEDSKDEHRLFVNVSTGRFLRRHLPLFRDHIMTCTSDGLVILGENEPPHAARVLNPLTGSLIHYAVPIPHEDIMVSAITGSDPTLVFYTFNDDGDVLWCADPTSKTFSVPHFCSGPFLIQNMAAYAGNLYTADVAGSLLKMVGTARAALLSRADSQAFEIFRVDVERNMLEAVKCIDSRALLLGPKSLSVDANKLPSINGNCLYYQVSQQSKPGMYMYDLMDGRESRILDTMVSQSHGESFNVRPRSLVQVLLGHCLTVPDVQAQLRHLYRTSED